MNWSSIPPRSTPLRSRIGLRPTRRRHMATDTPARRDNLTKAARFALWCMFDGHCAGCGRHIALDDMEPCHRQARGQGGDNTALWNRWPGCATCHRTGRLAAHRRPLLAEQRGLWVRSRLDPRTVPLTTWDGRQGYLTAAGTFEEAA